MVPAMPRTILCSAAAVDVDVDKLLQIVCIFKTVVFGAAVGHEPRDFFGFVCRIVDVDRFSLDFIIEINPLFVRCHQFAV